MKRILAVLLAICLVFGMAGQVMPAATVKAGDEISSTLDSLVVTDFNGLTEGTYTAEGNGSYATDYVATGTTGNLKNTMFEADITFGAAGAYITYGGANVNQGLKLLATESGLTLTCVANSSVTAEALASWTHELTPDIAGTPLVGEKFNLKLSVEFEDGDTDATIGIWFNDELYNDEYIVMEGLSNNPYGIMGTDGWRYYLGIHASETAPITITKPGLPLGYTPVTLWDYGLDDESVSVGHVTGQAADITSFNKKVVQAEFQINTAETDYIRIGNSDWTGIELVCDASGNLLEHDVFTNTTSYHTLLSGTDIRDEYVKVAMYITYTGTDDADLQVEYYINDTYKTTIAYAGRAATFGNYIHINASKGTIAYRSVGERERIEQEAVSYDISKKNYLVTGENVTINGNAATAGSVLSTPGDYAFERTVGKVYCQDVILYKVGDVDLDGTVGETEDWSALEAIVNGGEAAEAAKKGADLDNDGKVDSADLALANRIVSGELTLDNVLNEYYPPALSYDFLGGNEVMPIAGFFGPIRRISDDYSYDYLTDEIFERVQNSGINLVNYAWRDYYESEADVKAMLSLAEKYKIGYFVGDARLNTSYDFVNATGVTDATALTAVEVAQKLGDYSYYQSALGTHVIDEPVPDSSIYDTSKKLKYFQDISKTLNTYVNTNGFMTMRPEDATCFTLGTNYSEFWDTFIKNTTPQVLAFDDYPFNDNADEGVGNATGYFTSLSIVRQKAIDNKLPFWAHVQAGGDFESGSTATEGEIATEAETYWNVNTSLAYGAKGISWFTLMQFPEYVKDDEDGTGATATSGLIAQNHTTTKFYTYAQNANKQIQAVDEVLMKASNKGVVAAGGTSSYAYTQTNGVDDSAIISTDTTEHLTEVTADDTTYGALVGCFDYKESEAYYVVNYDVTENDTQNITLKFDNAYNYYTVADGVKTEGLQGEICTLNIPSGKAVLVVLEGAVKQPESWEVEGDWEPVEIYPADFEIEDGTYEKPSNSTIAATGTYAPLVDVADKDTKTWTLDGRMLSADVLLHGNYAGILVGGNASSTGIHLQHADGNLMLSWCEGGSDSNWNTILPATADENLTSFADTEFNLKVSMKLMDHDGQGDTQDIQVGIYINGKLYNNQYFYFDDCGSNFGNCLSVRVDEADTYTVINTPELNVADYEVFTTYDIGVDDTDTPGSAKGTYTGESMDGTLFAANLNFYGKDSNYLCFAGADGAEWEALRIGVHASGPMYLWAGGLKDYAGSKDWWNFDTPGGLFNLRVTTDYVDFDRDGYKDDLKIGIWMNTVQQSSGQYIHFIDAVGLIGNNFRFNVASETTLTVKEAPLAKNLGDLAYDLDFDGGYSIPEGATNVTVNGVAAEAGSSYTEAGDYAVQYTYMYTDYSGNIVLYRMGDVNMDGVVDSRDLIRMKKNCTELTISDAGIPDGEVPTSAIEGTFAGVETLDGAAVTFKATFPHDDPGSYVRIGGKNSNYYGLSIVHTVVDNKNALQFQWIKDDGSAITEYIYDDDVDEQLYLKEQKLRIEFSKVDANVKINVYINGLFAKTITYEGQAEYLGAGFSAVTRYSTVSVSKMHLKKAVAKSADFDGSGAKEESDFDEMRKLLLIDKEVVKPECLTTSDYIDFGTADSIVLDENTTTYTSSVVGYGQKIRVNMQTATEGNGDTNVFIGSYGFRIRGNQIRIQRLEAGKSEELYRISQDVINVSSKFFDAGNAYVEMRVDMNDDATTGTLWLNFVDGENAQETSCTFTRLTSGEIATEGAAVTFMIVPTEGTSKLTINKE